MSDIAEQLREEARLIEEPKLSGLVWAAADEIERLRAEVDRLREALKVIGNLPDDRLDESANIAVAALMWSVR